MKGSGLFKQTIYLHTFYRLSSTNFTWSILEYFVPNRILAILQFQRPLETHNRKSKNFMNALSKSLLIVYIKNSRSQIFFKYVFLKISQFLQESKNEFLFNKVAGLKGHKFIKLRLQHWCFPVNIAKFLRTIFSLRISGGCF